MTPACTQPLWFTVYTPAFQQQLIARLDLYVAELKQREFSGQAYIYTFDERGEEFWPIMREYFGLVKQQYGIPTLTTAYEYLWKLGDLIGDVEVARQACLPVTENLTTFTLDPQVLSTQRDTIARRVEELTRR